MVSTFTFIRPNAVIYKACTLRILQKYYKFDAHYSITYYAQLQFSDAKSTISNHLYQNIRDSNKKMLDNTIRSSIIYISAVSVD